MKLRADDEKAFCFIRSWIFIDWVYFMLLKDNNYMERGDSYPSTYRQK